MIDVEYTTMNQGRYSIQLFSGKKTFPEKVKSVFRGKLLNMVKAMIGASARGTVVPPQTLVRGVPGSNPARNAHLEFSRNALPGGEVKEGLPLQKQRHLCC